MATVCVTVVGFSIAEVAIGLLASRNGLFGVRRWVCLGEDLECI